jgi:hypothetical protein
MTKADDAKDDDESKKDIGTAAPAEKTTAPAAHVPAQEPCETEEPCTNFMDQLKRIVDDPVNPTLNPNTIEGISMAMNVLGSNPFAKKIESLRGVQGLTQMGMIDDNSDEWR